MKREDFLNSIYITIIVIIVIILVWGTVSCSRSGIKADPIDEYIQIDTISNDVIIVKMGYDAVTAIETEKGIVVVDAGISHSLTSKYRSRIEDYFKRTDFAFLINTHSHNDHTGGNQVFADAKIIGHHACLNEIPKNWADPEKRKLRLAGIIAEYQAAMDTLILNSDEWVDSYCQKNRYQHAYDDLLSGHNTTLPTLTIEDSLNISCGDITMNLYYFGKAHSETDILISFPELKLLMTGDLFFPGGRPSINETDSSSMQRWEDSYLWLSARLENIDIIIGGHGDVMTQSDLVSFLDYIKRNCDDLQ